MRCTSSTPASTRSRPGVCLSIFWQSRAAARRDGPQGGGGADSGAIGDDGNAAGRPPADAPQAEDRQDMPSTTATACYVTRRGGVTGRLAPRMLVVYDWCGGDGPAGGGRCAGPGGVAGGVRRVVRAGGG